MNAANGTKIKVQKKDILTVGEAFAGCDPACLLECVLAAEAGPRRVMGSVSDVACYSLMRQIADYLEKATQCAQNSLSVAIDPLPGIIVPFEWHEADGMGGGIRYRLGAALLESGTGEKARQALSCVGGYAYEPAEVHAVKNMLPDMATLEPWTWSGLRASSYWFAHGAWEAIVETPLWLPSEFDSNERHLVLAHLLWTMTQRGCDALSMPMIPSKKGEGLETVQQTRGPQYFPAQHNDDTWQEPLFVAKVSDIGMSSLGTTEAPHAQRLLNIVKLLNYNCWIDALEICVALEGQAN